MKLGKYISLAMVSCLFLIGCNSPNKSNKSNKKQVAFEAADEKRFVEQWMQEEATLAKESSPISEEQRLHDEIVALCNDANDLLTMYTAEVAAEAERQRIAALSAADQVAQGSFVASAEENLSIEATNQAHDIEILAELAMLQKQHNPFGSEADFVIIKDNRLSGGNCTLWFVKINP